jgi:hypothetical protein
MKNLIIIAAIVAAGVVACGGLFAQQATYESYDATKYDSDFLKCLLFTPVNSQVIVNVEDQNPTTPVEMRLKLNDIIVEEPVKGLETDRLEVEIYQYDIDTENRIGADPTDEWLLIKAKAEGIDTITYQLSHWGGNPDEIIYEVEITVIIEEGSEKYFRCYNLNQ